MGKSKIDKMKEEIIEINTAIRTFEEHTVKAYYNLRKYNKSASKKYIVLEILSIIAVIVVFFIICFNSHISETGIKWLFALSFVTICLASAFISHKETEEKNKNEEYYKNTQAENDKNIDSLLKRKLFLECEIEKLKQKKKDSK